MNEMPSMEPDDHVQEMPSTTRQTRGRGKNKVTTTTVTRQTLVDPEEEAENKAMTFAALFDPGPDDTNDETVDRVRVFRSEPREGHLGYIEDMDATETFIKDHWGGSTYKLEGVSKKGRIVRVRTIVVGGDPIFVGEAFESQWRKQRGLPARSANGNGESMSTKDMLALIETREASLRKELHDKEERDRKERTDRDESRRRDEREFQMQRERDQREWDERKRRDQEESDRRRAQEQDARDERRRRDVEEATARQQQFMTQMLTIVQSQAANTIAFVKETLGAKAGVDPSDMLMKGVTLAMKLREAGEKDEDGDGDLLTTVVKNLPEMLNSAGSAIGGAIREVKGLPQPAAAGKKTAGGLTLPAGPVSVKFAALVNRIQAAGGDPEAKLAQLADRLLASAPLPKAPDASKPIFDPGPPAPQEPATTAPSTTPQSANSATPDAPPSKAPAEDGVVRMAFGNRFGKPKAPPEPEPAPLKAPYGAD